MKISVNFVYFQSCNRAHAEEGDNSLRERYREKSAEVRQLQSKIMVSSESVPQMDRSRVYREFAACKLLPSNVMHSRNFFCNLQYELNKTFKLVFDFNLVLGLPANTT